METGEINDHKQALLSSGNLSDFHINNLKSIIPFAFKPYGLESFTIEYNFKGEDGIVYPGVVEYNLRFKGIPSYTKEEKEFSRSMVKECVKNIFFNETTVSLKVNGKLWN